MLRGGRDHALFEMAEKGRKNASLQDRREKGRRSLGCWSRSERRRGRNQPEKEAFIVKKR